MVWGCSVFPTANSTCGGFGKLGALTNVPATHLGNKVDFSLTKHLTPTLNPKQEGHGEEHITPRGLDQPLNKTVLPSPRIIAPPHNTLTPGALGAGSTYDWQAKDMPKMGMQRKTPSQRM